MSFRCALCKAPQHEGKVPVKVVAVERTVKYIYDEDRTFSGKEPVKEWCLCHSCSLAYPGPVMVQLMPNEKEKRVLCRIKETKKERQRREKFGGHSESY